MGAVRESESVMYLLVKLYYVDQSKSLESVFVCGQAARGSCFSKRVCDAFMVVVVVVYIVVVVVAVVAVVVSTRNCPTASVHPGSVVMLHPRKILVPFCGHRP